MTSLRLATVNRALRELGAEEQLFQGEGYFYFGEGDAYQWFTSTIPVFRLNHLTLEDYIGYWKRYKEEYESSHRNQLKTDTK